LVDRGTPEGYKSINEARRQILIKEGHLHPSDGSPVSEKVDNVHIVAPVSLDLFINNFLA